ncbi:hypothetical protein ADUPG1_012586 [Aduncisulcus paluster]|uniref:Reverse transcriptase n=1 Tax=Aduncisulcus paluster TaxID=2918883 RepID=A0ABQ5JZY3_9EUKA|nr:hypothetical protein ADUPG1_012586 [Aduncisulcus paluster]
MAVRRQGLTLKREDKTFTLMEKGTPFNSQPAVTSLFNRSAHWLKNLIQMRVHLAHTRAVTRIGDRSCLLCSSQLDTQNHALGGCPASMDDYRTRHHAVRHSIIDGLRRIHPLIPVLSEQHVDEQERQDITVSLIAPIYNEITIAYEDATIQSLESTTARKYHKYDDIKDSLIVCAYGHSGIFLQTIIIARMEELLPISERQILKLLQDAGQVALRESLSKKTIRAMGQAMIERKELSQHSDDCNCFYNRISGVECPTFKSNIMLRISILFLHSWGSSPRDGWRATAHTINYRLRHVKRLAAVAEWAALTSTGRIDIPVSETGDPSPSSTPNSQSKKEQWTPMVQKMPCTGHSDSSFGWMFSPYAYVHHSEEFQQWNIIEETSSDDSLRPDITVTRRQSNVHWIGISITYEDAALASLEKRCKEKMDKYGALGVPLVIGHAGAPAALSRNGLMNLGLSAKQVKLLLLEVGKIIVKLHHSFFVFLLVLKLGKYDTLFKFTPHQAQIS